MCPLVAGGAEFGEFWPRNSFLKHPGVIDVVIGPPILPAGQSAEALTRALESWTLAQQAALVGRGPCRLD